MGCPRVGGDNPRAFASRLSYIQVDKHDITDVKIACAASNVELCAIDACSVDSGAQA